MSQMTPDDFFTHNKGDANSLVRRDLISPFLGQFIDFFISWDCCLGIRTKESLLDPLSFSSTCILLHTRADSVVIFAVLQLLSYYQSRYVISFLLHHRQKEFCAPEDCHHFGLKHCREATHRNILLMVVPWSINTCTKAFVNS